MTPWRASSRGCSVRKVHRWSVAVVVVVVTVSGTWTWDTWLVEFEVVDVTFFGESTANKSTPNRIESRRLSTGSFSIFCFTKRLDRNRYGSTWYAREKRPNIVWYSAREVQKVP